MAAKMSHVDEETQETKHQERLSKYDKQLLETFWDLAATSDDKRVDGAGRLIDIVSRKQIEHQRNESSVRVCS